MKIHVIVSFSSTLHICVFASHRDARFKLIDDRKDGFL